MVLYVYIKAVPKINYSERLAKKREWLRFLPFLFLLNGLVFLAIVFVPIFSYNLLVFFKNQNRLISPVENFSLIAQKKTTNPSSSSVLAESDEKSDEKKDIQMMEEVDFNLIKNWFPTAPLPRVNPSKITHYNLSIPKLKIENALVTVGGESGLQETLVHYPGTAFPGEYGNVVIFGHSVLPVFYNPKNYKTIFSLLPTLQKGDKIFIYFDGIEYVYEVEDYFEVKPNDIRVLEQRFGEQTLSLVTCVPPGTYLRRGVVKARLVSL